MLKLFQSIFSGSERPGRYPESLVTAAIERAVDGSDPRVRAVPGYRRKLRDPVIRAIDHAVGLVEGLEAPLELAGSLRAADPELIAFFASSEHLREILSFDMTLRQYLKSPEASGVDHFVMLMMMVKRERKVLGVALEGDVLRRDVWQDTVSFAAHRLVDPAATEEEARRMLKRRAFDHLLGMALLRLAAVRDERRELEQQRSLLRHKSRALAEGPWGFTSGSDREPPDPQALQQRIADIEAELQALGAGTGLLNAHLDIVIDVLAQPERSLWADRGTICVDRMGISQTRASAQAPEVHLTLLHNAEGRSEVARLVGVARTEIPPPKDFFQEAARYLA
jgi:hypothetical protein